MNRVVFIFASALPVLIACGLSYGMDAGGDEQWAEFEYRGEKLYRMPVEVMRELGLVVPDLPDERNAAMYILKATEVFVKFDGSNETAVRLRSEPWTAEQFPEAAEWLAKNQEAFDLLDEALALDECYFPMFMNEPGITVMFGAMLSYLSPAREMTRALLARAHLHEGEGLTEEARADLFRVFGLANHLEEGSYGLINRLVALALYRLSLDAAEGVLSRMDPTPEMLAEWRAGLSTARENVISVAEAFKGEEVFYVNTFDSLIFSGDMFWLNPFAEVDRDREVKRAIIKGRAFRALTPNRTMRRDFLEYFEILDEALDVEHWEYDGFPDPMGHIKPYNLPYIPIHWLVFPAINAVHNRYGEHYAKFDALIQAVAVLRYHVDHGEYPEALDALIPDYIDELPPDPYTGERFRYSIEDDGFVIYSIGINREDDGGRTRQDEQGADDIVVRIKRD